MTEDWWPDLLRHIPAEKPWETDRIVVAEQRSYGDPWLDGSRSLYSALVPVEVLDRLEGRLIGFNYRVESSGPGPFPSCAGDYRPEFWISAIDGDHQIKCEPLVLTWERTNRTAMVIDPGFLMTYGLIPRTLEDGALHWDDLSVPEFSVGVVDAPSIYEDGAHSGARVTIDRDHLQDYLTLRGMALVQVYYENRRGRVDEAIEAALGAKDRLIQKFPDRELDFYRREGEGYVAQVWGARLVARPGDLPISVDPLERTGLSWPGIDGAITHQDARRFRSWDNIFIRDTVLRHYEGKPGFRIHPESGGVSYENQWSTGPTTRVGRDVLRLEIRKLYEGTARRVVQLWHAHAVEPTPDLTAPEGRDANNIGKRSHDLVYAMADLGARLAALGEILGVDPFTSQDVTGVARSKLDYEGWWNAPHVEAITFHVPIDMDRSAFLDRCVALAKVIAEALGQRLLRAVMNAIAQQPGKTSDFAGLKLLDRIVCLAQVGNDAGLSLWEDGQEITDRLAREGSEPAKPLDTLFALVDLRQAAAHRKDGHETIVTQSLARFGIDQRSTAGGWGEALDAVYDRLIEQIGRANRTLGTALGL